ncbi:hypothetical protein LEMLEM_LOCUS8352 [Lemmus lemmus]
MSHLPSHPLQKKLPEDSRMTATQIRPQPHLSLSVSTAHQLPALPSPT